MTRVGKYGLPQQTKYERKLENELAEKIFIEYIRNKLQSNMVTKPSESKPCTKTMTLVPKK